MPKYLVALAVGGLMECPEITYENFQEIEANSPDEARKIYNEKNDCSFFYGEVIREIHDTAMSDFEKFKKFFDDMGIKYEVNGDCLYLDGFETRGSQLIVVDFYEDGKFQCFSPYPDSDDEVYKRVK